MLELSIIIPVYNVEGYLKECLDSILKIKGIAYEIILIDDGSTDQSGTICDLYQEKFGEDFIKVVHKKNLGVSSARNEGIKKAKGKYIIFVDSDDSLIAENFTYVLEHIEGNDLVISGINYIYKNKKKLKKLQNNKINFENKYEINNNYKLLERQYVFYAVYGKVYKNSIIQENRLFFDTDFSILEDSIFVWKYLEKCTKVETLEKNFYNYRQVEGPSLVKKYNENAIDALVKKYNVSSWIINILDNENLKLFYRDLFYKLVEYIERIYQEETIGIANRIIKDYFVKYEIRKICRGYQYENKIVLKRAILYFLIKNRMVFLLGLIHLLK